MRPELQRSAGGVVARGGELLLIALHDGRRWQLPKGHLEPGESAEDAAVREVREETGVRGRPLAPLPTIEYWFVERGRRIHKRVDFFLLAYAAGSTADYDPGEVSGARWFPWDEGLARLTYDNERTVAAAAREAWADLGDEDRNEATTAAAAAPDRGWAAS